MATVEKGSIRPRVLKVLGKFAGNSNINPEIDEKTDLSHFGIDEHDKIDSLPWELQNEFSETAEHFEDLSSLKTLGDIIAHVESKK